MSRLKNLTNRIIHARSKQLSTLAKPGITTVESDRKLSNLISIDRNTLRTNRRILQSIEKSLSVVATVTSKNKTDEVGNPLDIFKKASDGGISTGILAGLATTILSKLFGILGAPIISLLTKGLSLAKKVKDFVLFREPDDEDETRRRRKKGKTTWRRVKRFGRRITRSIRNNIPRVVNAGKGILSRLTGVAARIGPQILARLGIMVAGGLAATGSALTGTVAGVALLASGVGIASYKIGRWLQLSERLDSVISKASNGKFRDLGDILLGITDGSIPSEIGSWIKNTVVSFFNRGYEFIRNKVTGLLEKLNPFSSGKRADAQTLANNANTASELNKVVENISNSQSDGDTGSTTEDVVDSPDSASPSTQANTPSEPVSLGQSISNKASAVYDSVVDTVSTGIESAAKATSSVVDKGKAVISSGIQSVGNFIFGESAPKNYNSSILTHFPTTEKRVNSAFGLRKHPIYGDMRMHTGVDIAVSSGTTVFSAGPGTVRSVGDRGDYGKTIEIEHGNGLRTLYAHLSEYSTQKGKTVSGGQPIAKSGNTGVSTAPHLHFEVIRNRAKENPVKHFGFTGKTVMGSNGYSRAPTPEEQRKGIGGISSVKGLPSIASRRSDTGKPIPPRIPMSKPDNTTGSGTSSSEVQSPDVMSPRIYCKAIELSCKSVLYT